MRTNSRSLRLRAALAALLAATAGACGLDAEAEADSVCVEQAFPDVTVPGAAVGVPPQVGDVLSRFTFEIEVGDVVPEDLEEEGVEADVNARSIALTSVARNADFAGVTLLTFDVVPPPGSGRATVPFRYERAAGATGRRDAVEARPTAPIDLVDYLQNGDRVRVTNLRIEGSAPPETWTPALRTCGDSRVEADLLDAAGL